MFMKQNFNRIKIFILKENKEYFINNYLFLYIIKIIINYFIQI